MTTKELKSCGALLALAAAALTLVTPTWAGNLTGPDVTVPYSDLDIDTVEGATQLLARIKVAADRVCAPLAHGDLASRATRDRCHLKLTGAAVARVDHPVLAAVYKSAYPDAPSVAALAK